MPLTIKKILLPTDFSEISLCVLPYAVDVCRKIGAELHIIHGFVLHHLEDHSKARYEQHIEEVKAKVAGLTENDATPFKLVTRNVRGIAPGLVILEYAGENEIDMILMATHGQRGLKRFFLGSVAEEVVRNARCPVLTMREFPEHHTVADGIGNILVPIDFSEQSIDALVYAREMAGLFDSALHLVHVVEKKNMPEFYFSARPAGEALHAIEESSREALKELLNKVRLADARMTVSSGAVVERISELAAESNADMIVMATHGLTGLKRQLLGSVAEATVREAPCPVLTVRTHERLSRVTEGAETRKDAVLY